MIKDFNKIAIITGDEEVSYAEMLRKISLFASQTPQVKDSKTVILSENRPGWAYALFSIWSNKGIAIPIDAASTVDDVTYILQDAQPHNIWVSNQKLELAKNAISSAKIECETHVIDDWEHKDASHNVAAKIEYEIENTALIVYTSGTTGSPKGVMLSYKNIFANIDAVSKEVPIFNSGRRTLILLPLHHILPLLGSLVAPIVVGGGVAISPSMASKDLMDTMNRGKVAIIIGVPRLYISLFNGIKKKLDEHAITRFLFHLCKSIGSRSLSRVIFKSIRKLMGGHITYCVSGGAALDKEIGIGLKTLGLDVLEGYGMTEAAPMISFTRPNDICPGASGQPVPSVQVEIREGEIYAKGNNIMQGYYKRPEETAEVLKDGWLYTGDLGYIDKKGRLVVTGRKKEIIVLSNGKNVNPNELEYKLGTFTDYVKEAGVLQDGDKLKAIIVPQPKWAENLNDEDVENTLREKVMNVYNQSVAPYKKIMSIFIYRGELPRTRLEKIQHYKLASILTQNATTSSNREIIEEPNYEEYHIVKNFIEEEKHVHVKPTDHLEMDLAFDSLDKISLQTFIQNTFGIDLTQTEIEKFKTISRLSKYIQETKTRIEIRKMNWNEMLKNLPKLKLPKTWTTGNLYVKICKAFFKIYFRISAKGKNNIPKNGPFILAPNHQSSLDGMLVMSFLTRKQILSTYFYAKEDHIKSKFRKWIAKHHNVIVIDITNIKESIQKLGEALKDGKNIIIFPEGTRTYNGQLNEFKKTFAILSKELNVPIIPVVINGAYKAMPRNKKYPLPKKITVEFLELIKPTDGDTYETIVEKTYQSIAKKVIV